MIAIGFAIGWIASTIYEAIRRRRWSNAMIQQIREMREEIYRIKNPLD